LSRAGNRFFPQKRDALQDPGSLPWAI